MSVPPREREPEPLGEAQPEARASGAFRSLHRPVGPRAPTASGVRVPGPDVPPGVGPGPWEGLALPALLDAACEAVLAMDHEGVIHLANPAMESLTGRGRGELVGNALADLVASTVRRRLEGALGACQRGEAARAELCFEQGDELRYVAFSFGPLRDASGAITGVVAIGRDVTDQRTLEEQLARADKLATVGLLAACVVHEINNPLGAILVYARHLEQRMRGGDPADLARIARVSEAAARIQSLVRRLLAYAPSSEEKLTYVSVSAVVDQAVTFCEPVLRERGVELRYQTDSGLPRVFGVAGQLVQVLVNLITNACHAAPTTGGQIHVAMEALADHRVAIAVEDNGHGISPGDMARIFEPFFTTKGSGRGTGLGLAIVRTILEQHGAELTVESELGRGSRFTIVLPGTPPDAVP